MRILRFGIQVDMRGEGSTDPDFVTALGAPRLVMSRSPLSIVIETTTGAQFVLRGQLDYSSEEKLRDSPITYVGTSHPDFPPAMFEVSGLTNMTFGDFEQMSAAQVERFVLNPPAGNGYMVYGSRYDDALVGLGGADQLFGGAGNDRLLGGAGNDVLDGSSGADRLDGGSGNDNLRGGAGNDVYVVDSRSDVVSELANGGTDVVYSSVSWTLGTQFEKLLLTGTAAINGTGNSGANVLGGNSVANVLLAGAGDDVLNGGLGGDRMEGGRGNDTFYVESRRDVVIEKTGAGSDTVLSSISYQLGANLEDLRLLGSGALNAVGNNLDNVLRGNAGHNHLNGLGGDDTLIPGVGFDVLTGGAGSDNFVFADNSGNADQITDFLSGTDRLWLDPSVFTAPGVGPLDASQLRDSAAAADGNDYLVYDLASGVLSYDASGSGAALHPLVSLGAGTVLLAGDITLGLPPV